jgi:hypothetical protein
MATSNSETKSSRSPRQVGLIIFIILAFITILFFLFQAVRCPPLCSGRNLTGRDFRNRPLDNTDFSGATLNGVDFTGASLNGANFSGADLSGAILSQTSMIGSDLTEAILIGAQMDWLSSVHPSWINHLSGKI